MRRAGYTRFARLDIKSLTNLFYSAAVILRLLLVWLINTVALIAVAYLMPSISVSSFESALLAALVLGLVNAWCGRCSCCSRFP